MRPFLSGYLPVGWDLTVGLLLLGLSVSRACFGCWENLKARFKAEMFGADFRPVHLWVFEVPGGVSSVFTNRCGAVLGKSSLIAEKSGFFRQFCQI